MIRFGMGLMEIVEQLTRGFMKATGKQPGNLEKLKIQQEAVQRFKEMNKVMDMQGRPIDPSKPIMGGSQQGADLKSGIMKATGARPRQVLSEDENRQKLMDQNKKGIKSLEERVKKNKEYQDLKRSFEDPEERAMGGRIGYSVGAGKKGVQALLDLVIEKFGKKAVTTADKAPIPPKTLERDMFKKFNNKNPDPKRQLTDEEIEEYEMELGDSETWMNDGTLGDAEQALKNHREYMEEIMRRKDAGEFGNFSSSKLDNVNDEQIAAAVDDIFPTGDPKYDAEMASEALVENNPQIFGDDVLLDDLDDETRSKIYGAVYDVLSNNMSKMRELKKLSKPEKTLQAMKEGKGIDISDPEIADEFTRFMKEKDPKGYKELEQKLELSNFDTKNRKKNAKGGRAGLKDGNPPVITIDDKIDEMISFYKDYLKKGGKMDFKTFSKQYVPENFASGGIARANFLGGGMGRRGFLKMLGGVGAGIGALKTGILGFGGKQAGKEVAKEVVKQSAGTPPPYFFKLAEKIKKFGSDSTPTNERTISKSLKSKDGTADYILEEDMATGDIQIKKVNMERDDMINDIEIMEFRKGEVVEGPGGKPVKTPDEYDEVTESISRIYKDDFNSPDYSEGIRVKEVMEEVMDAPSIKKASGGIARMLGE